MYYATKKGSNRRRLVLPPLATSIGPTGLTSRGLRRVTRAEVGHVSRAEAGHVSLPPVTTSTFGVSEREAFACHALPAQTHPLPPPRAGPTPR
eukprot:756686-Hanusia_phi.AAC.1